MKTKYHISLSGGRTSAYMAIMLILNFSHKYDFIITYANTGLEHEETLIFLKKLDEYFNLNVVWLEAVVDYRKGISTKHKIVDFHTASRNGEPFEEMIKKYGIPNMAYPHCTRELKLRVMHSYLKSIGIQHTKIPTAVGIREDESRRISTSADTLNIKYPLIDTFPSDKQDVLDFWSKQPFDLQIQEWDRNCKGCFKKSFKKIFKQLDSNPTILDFHIEMEGKYPQVANKLPYYKNIYEQVEIPVYADDEDVWNGLAKNEGDFMGYEIGDGDKIVGQRLISQPDRVFFRGQTSAKVLHAMYLDNKKNPDFEDKQISIFDGGCSESCEVYVCN